MTGKAFATSFVGSFKRGKPHRLFPERYAGQMPFLCPGFAARRAIAWRVSPLGMAGIHRSSTLSLMNCSVPFTLGMPTQMIYWTSGRSRKLSLGKLAIQLVHVPSWQLAFAKERAGEIVRALAWAGPERVHAVLKEIEEKVPKAEIQKVAQQVSRFPSWLASALTPVSIRAWKQGGHSSRCRKPGCRLLNSTAESAGAKIDHRAPRDRRFVAV